MSFSAEYNFAAAIAVMTLMLSSCTGESIKTMYSNQETRIESFIDAQLAANSSAYAVSNKGSERVVLVAGEGEGLDPDDTITFYYAGYTLTSASIVSSNLFASNRADILESAGWELTGGSTAPISAKLSEAGFVEGLRNGLEGVKAGEECLILFSGKYGFGSHKLGTIPANSALVYHIWVESISKE